MKMNYIKLPIFLSVTIVLFLAVEFRLIAQVTETPFFPSWEEVDRPFGGHDEKLFQTPTKLYRPETWFHYIGGNVSKEGITRDLEAIAKAGISGIQLFHGQFGGPWPGVEPQITSLSAHWDDAVRHTATECQRLGLRLTMLNCPGWATSGGPWIEPENAMRHLVWSRSDVTGGTAIKQTLAMPQPSDEPWRDYKSIAVLAFPTPADDTGEPLVPKRIKSNAETLWNDYFLGKAEKPIRFAPTTPDNPQWVEVTFENPVLLRSVEFPSINSFNHAQCHEPGVTVSIQAVLPDGTLSDILNIEMPQANSQDDKPITLACSEMEGVKTYRISFVNQYPMALSSLRLFSAARKNSWESEAAWTLRAIEHTGRFPDQSPEAFISPDKILDISDQMDENGHLNWKAPAGKWTILRIGHVNTGQKNGPAPPEGTGWEANKLSKAGPNAQFAGYIGRLIGEDGPLADGLLDGMLIDSWECYTQTWTEDMENEFNRVSNYPLRKWLPALFGYVIKDHGTSTRFLYDWRATINDLFTHNFYGRMSELAHKNGLNITFETAAGDVFPADIMEYFKYADVPMCEFWHPMTDGFVGSKNFKPIRPTASAARLYGKTRVAAESFTSFELTWDEHFEMLKEVANFNSTQGVSHFVFHTYTHNPQTPFFPPGSSFGAQIGTPFLRGQTWWKFMPEFTNYLARCSYLLERGKPVSDVLWYLGDEINHKPYQNAPFPEGFTYDYCNPDILLNRLTVEDGMLVTPEGIQYRVLWLPDVQYMLPETLEKIQSLLHDGATIIGDAPMGLVTLSGGETTQHRFDVAVRNIWGTTTHTGMRKVGKGVLFSGTTLQDALSALNVAPDVIGGDALWTHRQIEGADWYFVTAPKGRGFQGTLDFRNSGNVELWDPVTGHKAAIESERHGDRTTVKLDLARAGSCFVVFRKNEGSDESPIAIKSNGISSVPVSDPWTLSFPEGWGAPKELLLNELKPWKDLNISEEGKAFSGTATYTTTIRVEKMGVDERYVLNLGDVDMVAVVSINGESPTTLWAPPYRVDVTDQLQVGENTLTVDVTSTWFNRLVYDAGQPENKRKTWTIAGPKEDTPLRASGLLGPVTLEIKRDSKFNQNQ